MNFRCRGKTSGYNSLCNWIKKINKLMNGMEWIDINLLHNGAKWRKSKIYHPQWLKMLAEKLGSKQTTNATWVNSVGGSIEEFNYNARINRVVPNTEQRTANERKKKYNHQLSQWANRIKRKAMCLHKYLTGYRVRCSLSLSPSLYLPITSSTVLCPTVAVV